jgi:hypothetical protein
LKLDVDLLNPDVELQNLNVDLLNPDVDLSNLNVDLLNSDVDLLNLSHHPFAFFFAPLRRQSLLLSETLREQVGKAAQRAASPLRETNKSYLFARRDAETQRSDLS